MALETVLGAECAPSGRGQEGAKACELRHTA
jgi:hypothetical protein